MNTETLLTRLSALADKSRFTILQLMGQGCVATCCDRMEAFENGYCVADVVNVTGLSQPTVSHHLKALENVGLIRKEVRGPWTCYFPNPEAIEELFIGMRDKLLPTAKSNADAKGTCCS